MRTCNCIKLVLALFGFGLTAIQARAQSIYTPYAFTNFAGAPGGPGSADGIGSAAQFNVPHSAAVDSAGNVYVGDTFNHTIRKIAPGGVVTTLAGGYARRVEDTVRIHVNTIVAARQIAEESGSAGASAG